MKKIDTILRKENFGFLLYDRDNLKTRAIESKELCVLKSNVREIVIENENYDTLSAPIKIFLEITKRCNLHCIHCSNNSGEQSGKELSIEDIEKTLIEIDKMGVFEVGINGGEPLCHPNFFDIVNIIKKYGFPIYLNTNGVYSQSVLERLSDVKIDKIKISVDGLKKSHDYIRGKGSFDKTISNIRFLKKMNNDIQINFTANRINKKDIISVIELSDSLNCPLKIAPMIIVGRAKNLILDKLSIKECQKIKKQIDTFCIKNNISIKIDIASDFIADNCKDITSNYHYQFTKCGIRLMFMSIASDGNVYNTGKQTDFSEEYFLGSQKDKMISKLWEEAKLKNKAIINNCGMCKDYNIKSLLFDSFNN
jgi:MoaA/NifB/PqqE/SkfB family radical SAM enzyme